jgi:hypothetical protein
MTGPTFAAVTLAGVGILHLLQSWKWVREGEAVSRDVLRGSRAHQPVRFWLGVAANVLLGFAVIFGAIKIGFFGS